MIHRKNIRLFIKKIIKDFFCDIVIGNKIIVELKAIKSIGVIDRAQILNYLKVTDLKLGMLINFGETSLKYERILLELF